MCGLTAFIGGLNDDLPDPIAAILKAQICHSAALSFDSVFG
jgi:hypothetical protein